MNTAAEVLLIVVSATLTLFLLAGIAVLVLVFKVLREIRSIAKKAEKIADKAEAVGEFFQKSAGSTALIKLIANIVHSVHSKKEKE